MKTGNFLLVLVLLAAAGSPVQLAAQATSTGSGQAYPAKPVRVIVPFPPGGGTDVQARVLFKEMGDQLKQIFIIDNRSGAGGLVGAEVVVNSPADGYTLLLTTATIAINATLYAKILKFNPEKQLAPVTWVSTTPLVLSVHPSVPVRTAREMIDLARRKPGVFNAAINVPGSTSHMSAELLKQLAKVSFTTVPYKGGGLSMTALISGEVDFQFAEGLLVAPQAKAGKARVLAVSTQKPSPTFPGLPTMETILPGFVIDQWFGLFVPAGTPREIIMAVNGATKKALNSNAVRTMFEREALTAIGDSPEEFGAHVKREIARYAEIIRKGNITVQ
jgi:tripartite-type tricarboxylate transporter receptor subunit TctC